MSALMKKRLTDKKNIFFWHAGIVYKIPKKVAEKYIYEENDHDFIASDEIFSDINKKYTRPGALLRGLRTREHLTQIELADKLHVTQSDISQMENGVRVIGRAVAQRIEKLFDIDYRSFLE